MLLHLCSDGGRGRGDRGSSEGRGRGDRGSSDFCWIGLQGQCLCGRFHREPDGWLGSWSVRLQGLTHAHRSYNTNGTMHGGWFHGLYG